MERFALALAALSVVFLISGCFQGGAPAACASAKQSAFANCVYINAVMEQNPFYCYSLPDKYQRSVCIQDASDPKVKAALERADQETREAIFAEKQPQPPPSVPQENVSQPPQPAELPANGSCGQLQGIERDDCYRMLAVEGSNISACEEVNASSLRESCIAQVAQMLKKPEICLQLSMQGSIDLCNFYSKAGVN
jgi:hypothetical protein